MAAAHWYIARNGQKVGPFTPAELRPMAHFGLLQPAEMIWTEGLAQWVEASTRAWLFPPAGQKRYWLALDGRTRGPYGVEQVRAALAGRQVTPETLACPEDGEQWQPLAQLTEFRGFSPSRVSPSQARLL